LDRENNKKRKQKENNMSQASDDLDQLEANQAVINQGITDANTGVQALDAQIAAFQNSPGAFSAADQARLDAITKTSASVAASMKALAAAANAPVTATPPAPIPAPVVAPTVP
jgi:hypothetical protein